jgi:hypothetical protein
MTTTRFIKNKGMSVLKDKMDFWKIKKDIT